MKFIIKEWISALPKDNQETRLYVDRTSGRQFPDLTDRKDSTLYKSELIHTNMSASCWDCLII